MSKIELIATATFGLEAIVKREVEQLGYKIIKSEDAKITYLADERGIVRSNLWLRSADRVFLKMGEFTAKTFEDLFQQIKALPWDEWIPEDGKFTVTGTSVKSTLHSVPDCQAIVKKAIVRKMQEVYKQEWFSETGAAYTVKFTILKDMVTVMIDTSGQGLHKRGYRIKNVEAPIKETLAAAMVQLSFWKPGRLLIDPFCGSGTIAIEAAMYKKNIAPGLTRKFVSEAWDCFPPNMWKEERVKARSAIRQEADVRIAASDINKHAVTAARENAEEAGVADCIHFRIVPFEKIIKIPDYSVLISNPPYGERMGEQQQLDRIYAHMGSLLRSNPTLSVYLITADKTFEKKLGVREADRRRKLYNGRIETCFYQYYGMKPPKVPENNTEE